MLTEGDFILGSAFGSAGGRRQGSGQPRGRPVVAAVDCEGVGGVAQQLARGFGVAVGAALLAVIAGAAQVTIGNFALALYLIALIPLLSALGFLRLSSLDGAEVSGYRRTQPRSA